MYEYMRTYLCMYANFPCKKTTLRYMYVKYMYVCMFVSLFVDLYVCVHAWGACACTRIFSVFVKFITIHTYIHTYIHRATYVPRIQAKIHHARPKLPRVSPRWRPRQTPPAARTRPMTNLRTWIWGVSVPCMTCMRWVLPERLCPWISLSAFCGTFDVYSCIVMYVCVWFKNICMKKNV